MIKESKTLKVRKPVVSKVIAEFIENTRDDEVLDVVVDTVMRYPKVDRDNPVVVTPEQEIAHYVQECLDEFIIARNYAYEVK